MAALDLPQRWPLVTNPQNRGVGGANNIITDGRLVNCYAELDDQTKEFDVIKRPGWENALLTTFPAGGNGAGMTVWTPIVVGTPALLSVRIEGGTPKFYRDLTFISNVNAFGTSPRFDWQPLNTLPTSSIYFKGAGGFGYMWDGTTLFPIADAFYVSIQNNLAPGIAYLNGRVYVVTFDGKVYGASNLDDVFAWDALNVIVANDTPGSTVGIVRHLQYVLVMKGENTEVFFDAGNEPPGSPLSRVDGARVPFGCSSFDTVKSLNDVLYWVGKSLGTSVNGGDHRVIQMKGLQPRVISTPAIERFLSIAFTGGTHYTGTIVNFLGHRFYALWCQANNPNQISFWFDIDQEVWTEVVGGNTIIDGAQRTNNGPIADNQRPMLYQTANGFFTQLNPNKFNDFLTTTNALADILVDIYTPNLDFGTDRSKQLSAMYFTNSLVTPPISGPAVTKRVRNYVTIRRSDDDYNTWSAGRTVDLSLKKPMIADEGSFYRRAYNFRHQLNLPLRMRSISLQMDTGVG